MIKEKIIYTTFSDWRFNIKKAKESFIWDQAGHRLLDFTSGWNVANLGWNNPEISKAVIAQVRKNTYAPMWTADPVQKKYADFLVKYMPSGLDSIGRATGGMEAIEEAIKLARSATGRKKIVGFVKSYHGQSIHCLVLSYLPEWYAKISNPQTDLVHLPFPNLYCSEKSPQELLSNLETQLEKILRQEDVAAILTESGTITGWGSTDVAPDGFLTLLRKLTQRYGTLLILDEVGSGFSRLGKLFAWQIENVCPDIITLAKGISNGAAPIGDMVTTQQIAVQGAPAANLQSTFGWIPPACAAALQTLKIHIREKIWEKAFRDGEYIKLVLKKEFSNNPFVGDVRGRGMEIGIDLVQDGQTQMNNTEMVEKVVSLAYQKGLHLVSDHESVIQLMPPLTIERKVLDKGLEILIECIRKAGKK